MLSAVKVVGPEAVELEWIYAIRWLVQLGAHFPATQERLHKDRLKGLQFSLFLSNLGAVSPESVIKKN